jgi:splicing suppressor protein 51
MIAEQPYEAAVSFSTWDNFFFTRDFPSIDSDRAIRHVSKVLTYPITIAGVLHQNGPYTYGNSRITSEGRRSMAGEPTFGMADLAIHSILHLPPGSSSDTAPEKPQPPFRLFLLGARAESTLPPAIWEQFTHLFPRTNFNVYFIGPEVGLPLLDKKSPRRIGYEFQDTEYGVPGYTLNVSPRLQLTSLKGNYEMLHEQLGPFDPYTDVFFAFSPGLGFPHQGPTPEEAEDITLDRAEQVPAAEVSSSADAAANAYSLPEAETTTPIDAAGSVEPAQPLVQAQTSWRQPLTQILKTKCPIFFTAFSPLDLERDVSTLFGTAPPSGTAEFPSYVNLPTRPVSRIPGVSDEFELVLSPGKNEFGSLKWEIAEWDVRVGVKTNWGVWGIRGKKYEVVGENSL